MESIFRDYGIEIVVGIIVSVLAVLFSRVIYFGLIKNNNKDSK